MSFRTNKFQQISIMDSYNTLSEREKAFMEKSWAGAFSELVFPQINEEHFEVLYSTNKASRPNTPVNIVIGALILKEMFGLTDEELVESIMFDVRYQHALHTTSFTEQPFSDRTCSRFREKVLVYELETGIDLLKQEMYSLAEHYRKLIGVSHCVKRMDSIMISTNSRNMSRLELFYSCVESAVMLLHRTGQDELLKGYENYLAEDERNNTIYRCKPEDTRKRLEKVAADAVELKSIMGEEYADFTEYQNLKRLIEEQVKIKGSGLELCDPQNLPAGSLQSSTDPEATYCSKAGKKHTGYVGNVVETVDEKGAVITQYDYRKNNYADYTFCQDVINELGKQDEKVSLIADGAYSGMDNVELARANNIELVTTALMGTIPSDIHSDFVVDREKHIILKCPMGHEPERLKYSDKKDAYNIWFDRKHCENCINREKCKAKLQQKKALVYVSQKTLDRAKYIKEISQPHYIKLQRKRNAIEGIPSVLRRKYHVDAIPVRGFLQSKLWFSFKIGAINVVKLLKAEKDKAFSIKCSMYITIAYFMVRIKAMEFNRVSLLAL
jgi:hypothetical protein